MRLLSELPEIEEKISGGELNLSHLSLAQTLFRQEKRIHRVEISKADKLQVLESFSQKSTREAERIAFSFSSAPAEFKSDRIHTVSENQVEMRFVASLETQKKIETLKGWLAHKHPDLPLGELFEKLCDLALEEWNPQKTAAPRKQRVGQKACKGSSKAGLRREIFRMTQNLCANCGSRHALQIDHIRPRAFGGDDHPENFRLLCRACNQRAAIRNLGFGKMSRYLR